MKIGIYCTGDLPFPVPAGEIRANLALAGEEANTLVSLGADVTFFAREGTKTNAKLVTITDIPKIFDYLEANHFDVFQTHCPPLDVVELASHHPNIHTVITAHDPLHYPAYHVLPDYNRFPNLHFVSITNAQRATRPGLTWDQTIYNGIAIDQFTFNPNPGSYLFYCGRVMPQKGPDLAIQMAIKTGLALKIAGSIYDDDQPFFKKEIAPYLNGNIEYFGTLPQAALVKIYQQALALIAPIRWEEPFGLVYIEAMATGTPVIATRHGSVPEVIIDKQTGFIIDDENNLDKFAQAIKDVGKIDRQACRHHVEQNFTLEKMTQNYLSLYQRLVNPQPAPSSYTASL